MNFITEDIRALSWKQPYAELMFHGKIETRTWDTKYRGWVMFCASKQPYNINSMVLISGAHQMGRMPYLGSKHKIFGKAVGVGNLIHVRPMRIEDEDKCFVKFNPDLFCHIYDQVFRIEPFDWKGTQGWKTIDEETKRKIKLI